MYVCIYIYIERERDTEREREKEIHYYNLYLLYSHENPIKTMQMVILSVLSSTKQVASMPSSASSVDTRVDLDVAGALGASLPP